MRALPAAIAVFAAWVLAAGAPPAGGPGSAPAPGAGTAAEKARLRARLTTVPHRIVHESYRDGSWELVARNADGSRPVALTRTPDVDELYPHACPEGRRVCFVADAGSGRAKVRSVYWMDLSDPERRTLVARNARQPCWSPDGRTVLFARGEYPRFTYNSYATKGLFFHDVRTGRQRRHPNAEVLHACYICWAPPTGRWILATIHGGMGYGHANVAIETGGTAAVRLPLVGGCRPEVSPDGRRLVWNATDEVIATAEVELSGRAPVVRNVRTLVRCARGHKVYHADVSPCGRFVAFAHGPGGSQHVGLQAPGWNICVADAARRDVWVAVTTDGLSNKEPDWVRARGEESP